MVIYMDSWIPFHVSIIKHSFSSWLRIRRSLYNNPSNKLFVKTPSSFTSEITIRCKYLCMPVRIYDPSSSNQFKQLL